MPAQRVIVEISPSRVEIAVHRRAGGDLAEWRSERSARAEWPSGGADILGELVPVLTRLVAETGSAHAAATVIFSTPGAVCTLTSCPAKVGATAAEQAALLALGNVADFPVDDAPVDACVLFTDSTSTADAAPQTHVLTGADAEQRAAALAAMLQSCGLNVERLIPAEAVAIADAVRAATADHAEDRVSAVVWIGEHCTVLAAGAPGRLMFVRTIAAGAESLVEALTRPLRARNPDAAPVTLSYDGARELLYSVGVPIPEASIPGHPTLAGSSLLPHIQPVLQRLSIEIKQSLRFGVNESDRGRVRLMAMGPGAAAPGLIDAVSRLSGFPAEPISEDSDATDSSIGGLIAALSRCPRLSMALMPTAVRELASIRRTRRALLAGIGAAALFIGYETFDARNVLAAEEARLRSIQAAAENQKASSQIREKAFASRQALSGVDARMRKALGESPDFSALLSILSERTPETVRITALDMSREGSSGRLSVRGYVRLGTSPDPAGAIRTFVDNLAAFPIVESVRLGATSRSQVRGHESQVFDLNVSLVSLPPLHTGPTTPSGSHTAATTGQEADK